MYNQPVVMGMGKSRYVARHNTDLLNWVGETGVHNERTLGAMDSLYIKRDVENATEVIRSVKDMLATDAILRSAGSLHVSVLQPEIAHRLGLRGRTFGMLTKAAKQKASLLGSPTTISFDRIARYPSRSGETTLVSLTSNEDVLNHLDLETENVIRGIGRASGYQGEFRYLHHPHITLATEDEEPPLYEETLLETPISVSLAKAAFFIQRLA